MENAHLNAMDLNLLIVFDAIYKHRNLTLAAKELGRTQSAVSHALERLRNHFNDRLFVRTSKAMRPTPRTEELIGPIRSALNSISSTLTPPGKLEPTAWQKTFSVLMSDYCQMVVLPKLLSFFSKVSPKSKLVIKSLGTETPQRQLESGEIDLIVGNKDLGDATFQQTIYSDHFVCLVNKQLFPQGTTLSRQEYFESRHIIFSTLGKEDRVLSQTLKSKGLSRNVVAHIPNVLVIPQIIKSGPFVATLPSKLAESIEANELRVMDPPFRFPNLEIMQYWHEAMQEDQSHTWFRNAIQRLFHDDQNPLVS